MCAWAHPNAAPQSVPPEHSSRHPRGACEEEEVVVAAFHSPRDAVEFALELQRGLLGLKWPRSVLEMEQFKPQYLAEMWVGRLCQGCQTPLKKQRSQ